MTGRSRSILFVGIERRSKGIRVRVRVRVSSLGHVHLTLAHLTPLFYEAIGSELMKILRKRDDKDIHSI